MRFHSLIAAVLIVGLAAGSQACCPLGRSNQPIVNADQTVLMIWNRETKTQHFIRKANFWTAGKDFGFVVPSPSYPQLSESGEEAFELLKKITAPVVRRIRLDPNAKSAKGTATRDGSREAPTVRLLHEQDIAGFHAAILEADDAGSLKKWLADNEFPMSEAFTAWADPYIRKQWKFTALKLQKQNSSGDGAAAKALRISFNTETPIFPYREPESNRDARKLNVSDRLLRLYFLAETEYRGKLGDVAFETHPVWSGKLSDTQRRQLSRMLALDENGIPAKAWLTEFEHHWPYRLANADVEFHPVQNPREIQRPEIVVYVGDFEYYFGDYAPWILSAGLGLAVVVLVFWNRRLRAKASDHD